MQLTNSDETYEFELKQHKESENPEGDDSNELDPVFILSKLTTQQVDWIDDSTSVVSTKTNDVRVMVGKVKSLKIEYALKDWRNVVDKEGKPVKCTSENKKRLPIGVRERLLEHIDEINDLSRKRDEEDEKK